MKYLINPEYQTHIIKRVRILKETPKTYAVLSKSSPYELSFRVLKSEDKLFDTKEEAITKVIAIQARKIQALKKRINELKSLKPIIQ